MQNERQTGPLYFGSRPNSPLLFCCFSLQLRKIWIVLPEDNGVSPIRSTAALKEG